MEPARPPVRGPVPGDARPARACPGLCRLYFATAQAVCVPGSCSGLGLPCSASGSALYPGPGL